MFLQLIVTCSKKCVKHSLLVCQKQESKKERATEPREEHLFFRGTETNDRETFLSVQEVSIFPLSDEITSYSQEKFYYLCFSLHYTSKCTTFSFLSFSSMFYSSFFFFSTLYHFLHFVVLEKKS